MLWPGLWRVIQIQDVLFAMAFQLLYIRQLALIDAFLAFSVELVCTNDKGCIKEALLCDV